MPLLGKARAIPEKDWDIRLGREQWEQSDTFATKAKAAYPQGLNMLLARALVAEAIRRRSGTAPAPAVDQAATPVAEDYGTSDLRHQCVGVSFPDHLRGQAGVPREKGADDHLYIGGLRRCGMTIARMPQARAVGQRVRAQLEALRTGSGAMNVDATAFISK